MPKYSRSTSEERQEEIRRHLEDPEVTDEQALRIVRAKTSWKDWLFLDYARYLYGIAALMLDVFVVIWLVDEFNVSDLLGGLLVLAVFILLAIAEAYGYSLIWSESLLDRDGPT